MVLKRFTTDENGAALIFVAVCLTAMLGFAALTFDVGRVAATQSDMQAYADHVALAAAGELDGKANARDRAQAAAEQAIQDSQVFGTLEGQVLDGTNDFTLRFLKALPPTDREYWAPDDLNSSQYLAANDFEATMVEVTTRNESVFLPFYRAFAALTGNDGLPGDSIVFARAVAGYTQYACDIATLMFCMPQSNQDALLAPGNSMRLRTGGNNESWGPGNFGFLDPADSAIDPNGPCAPLSGSARYQCLIASSGNRTRCFAQRGVDMNTGQAVGIENAVYNTRFDIYNSTMSKNKGNEVFRPAMHRVTGYESNGGGQCLGNNVTPAADSMAFQPAECHGQSPGCGAFTSEEWDVDEYIAKNYGTVTEPNAETGQVEEFPMTYARRRDTNPFFENLPDTPSRFDVYKAEHAATKDKISTSGPNASMGNGLPQSNNDYSENTCSTVSPSTDINRRVFIVAGIDCAANAINGAKKDVPVEQYYEVFLMRPVGMENGGPGNFDLHVEMIGPTGGDGSGNDDDGGIFRVVVELLR